MFTRLLLALGAAFSANNQPALARIFRTPSNTSGVNKYKPHDGKRQQERHALQRQTARVLVPTKNGGYKARTMNAWLARRLPLVVVEGGAQ